MGELLCGRKFPHGREFQHEGKSRHVGKFLGERHFPHGASGKVFWGVRWLMNGSKRLLKRAAVLLDRCFQACLCLFFGPTGSHVSIPCQMWARLYSQLVFPWFWLVFLWLPLVFPWFEPAFSYF